METEIFAKIADTPPKFYLDTKVRLRETVARWDRRLQKARVFLDEENGSRGVIGTRCRLVLQGRHGWCLVTTGFAGDADTALHKALQRANERVRRREDRGLPSRRTHAGRRTFGEAA